eukprot:CAMPEP_0204572808 /NCGR_PEP_ID=MMETSP0661-20131031/39666_1 /ASSEMBLY_ACC=CAM_ASM_000606 /TAXON_ID=109239 /ORGANISM="Alexandrium margalefi, Strain AMGDE01CS-322" /LENGTH=200 /DNA_ID=CAMNT_0051581183 /DNA_START=90 /DNA_END=688 /DNA_ORIENTATION=+
MSLFAMVFDALLGVQTEIVIFLTALCVHTVLFGSYRLKQPKQPKLKQVVGTKASSKPVAVGSKSGSSQAATVAGADDLVRLAKQLLRQGASGATMMEELGAAVQASHADEVCAALASMLDGVGKSASAELVSATREILREHDLLPTSWLTELLLKNLLTLRLPNEFQEVLAEAEAEDVATPSIAVLALRSSLAASDLDTA